MHIVVFSYVCVNVYTYNYIQVCMYIQICVYICMYVQCLYVCMYIIGTLFGDCTVTIWTLYVCMSTPHLLFTVFMYTCFHYCVLYAGVNKQKKKIIIMRGLPGSGKSTLARFVTHCAQVYTCTWHIRCIVRMCVCVCGTHCRDLRGRTGVICSTDDFFFQNGQ